MIHDCFAADSTIPVLKNGEELPTAFGLDSTNPWLNYGKEITIEIAYDDLEGKHYTSKVPLKVHAREGFGGGVWSRNSQ